MQGITVLNVECRQSNIYTFKDVNGVSKIQGSWEELRKEVDFDDLILSLIGPRRRPLESSKYSLASQPRTTLVLDQSESSDSIGGCGKVL